jgi:hypothetical protein
VGMMTLSIDGSIYASQERKRRLLSPCHNQNSPPIAAFCGNEGGGEGSRRYRATAGYR